MLNDITLLTANFNNSYMIMKMLESFMLMVKQYINVVIIDNSDKIPVRNTLKELFTVIDNTNFKLTPNYNQGSKNHAASIDFALQNCINTKYVLLCDSDILFKYEFKNFLDLRHKYDAIGNILVNSFVLKERLDPCCCIFDVEKYKMNKINYFDNNRCIEPNIPGMEQYDTGASFLEDIQNAKWKIKTIHQPSLYYAHFMDGTHKSKEEYIQFLNDNNIQGSIDEMLFV